METKTYHTRDKTDWGQGPWQREPDKMQFEDEETGLPCLIVRNATGALCGYVGVPPSHPLHEVHYSQCTRPDECEDEDWHFDCTPEGFLKAHGGITFTDSCHEDAPEAEGICHLPGEGEEDHVWWFGFDCAHLGDNCPKHGRSLRGTYKDIPYVKREIASLAQQLAGYDDSHL